ncbi:hypothetical protein DEO72_LG7g155 [Vigna unguiculata]|uniref:Secreted protein n=1 Tax=Vigna unguiculata TaxID=3917 RepID=A0A4D6MD17_VIGUN|nr:hypothetical protein DEO72_LG7g155 [Vigna unguiculata]
MPVLIVAILWWMLMVTFQKTQLTNYREIHRATYRARNQPTRSRDFPSDSRLHGSSTTTKRYINKGSSGFGV